MWRFHFSTGKWIQPISFIIIIYTEIDLVTHGACWVETQLNVKKLPFLYRLTKATQTQISSRNTYLYCSRKKTEKLDQNLFLTRFLGKKLIRLNFFFSWFLDEIYRKPLVAKDKGAGVFVLQQLICKEKPMLEIKSTHFEFDFFCF